MTDDPFADAIAGPPAPEPPDETAAWEVMLYQGSPAFDHPMPRMHDLSVDDAMNEMMALMMRRSSMSLLETGFGEDEPLVLDDPLYVPESDAELEDTFARYANPSMLGGGVYTPPPPNQGIPAGPDTFGPLEKSLFPSDENGVARDADPSGMMREVLRKLVRSV